MAQRGCFTQRPIQNPQWLVRRFYFAYCEAAFDAKYIHNFQILWSKASAAPALGSDLGERSSGQELLKAAVTPAAPPADPVTQVTSRIQRHKSLTELDACLSCRSSLCLHLV
jgi:hypothetical protein